MTREDDMVDRAPITQRLRSALGNILGFGYLFVIAFVAVVLVGVSTVLERPAGATTALGRSYRRFVVGFLEWSLRPIDWLS